MRTVSYSLGLLLLCALPFTSCKKDSIAAGTEQPAALTQGAWKMQAAHGSISNNTPYHLQFATDGTLTCNYETATTRGSWQWQRKVESGALRLQLIDGRAAIAVLHNEWEVKSCTPATLTLSRPGLELRFVRP